MDRRTLLFVIVCSITFFGLNIYFSSQRDKEARLELKEREAKEMKESKLQEGELTKKRAELTHLPLVTITSQDQKPLGFALAIQENLLTVAWESRLPETLISQGKSYTLATKDYVVDGPVVYASTKEFIDFEIGSLPKVGTYDVELISFPENKKPLITLAEYRDGSIVLLEEKPSKNALVIYKDENGYLPFGFYESSSRTFVEMQDLPLLSSLKVTKKTSEPQETQEETFYLLENSYMQVVFSNVGGSIAEINLPFQSEKNQVSVVKEIGFDRTITSKYPNNALFPMHTYVTPKGDEVKGKLGGYYPLLRRGVTNGGSVEIPEEYRALNIVSDYPEQAKLQFEVLEYSPTRIVFQSQQPYRKITKTYKLNPEDQGAPYCFDLEIKIEGDSRNLWLTSGIPEVEIMSNSSSPQIQYRLIRKGKGEVEKLDLPKAKEIVTVSSVNPDWVSNSNGYLGLILNPLSPIGNGYKATAIEGAAVPTRLSVIDPQYHPYKAASYPGYELLLPLPNKAATVNFRIFAGPFEEGILKEIDQELEEKTGQNPDYASSRTFYGWFSFISEPFAKFLFIVMSFFYTLTHSWVAAIVLLTVFLRILLYPLNAWSIKSMARMKEISPEVQAIQKKYKKEPKKAQMEIMNLYRENKVNPFSGCVPIIIQIPFLIAMFDLLKSSFQLRGASFIPGWIDNLTAPDVLFSWNRPLFFIGNEFHLLPFILGAVMFIQQRMSAASAAKKGVAPTDQERQQKAMGTMMAVLFTVMFYNFPSGLNIYWLSSMLLGILQQWATTRYLTGGEKKARKRVVKK